MAAGRPRGRPRKDAWADRTPDTSSEAQEFAESFVAKNVKDYLRILDAIARDEAAKPDERRQAVKELLERGLGKPGVPERDTSVNDLKDLVLAFAELNRSTNERTLDAEGGARYALLPGEDVPPGTRGEEAGQEAPVHDAAAA